MPFETFFSTEADLADALTHLEKQWHKSWSGRTDLALVFVSPHHAETIESQLPRLRKLAGEGILLGCTGESIVANGQEIEGKPAISLWLGRWNDEVKLTPFHLAIERTSEGMSLLGWPDVLAEAGEPPRLILMLGEPFTFPIKVFFEQLEEQVGPIPVMGGMASGATRPGGNRLIFGDAEVTSGGVGVVFQGAASFRTVVSQGCRPIGHPLVITSATQNVIHELGGKPPLAHLQEIWSESNAADRALMQQGLHVGVVMNEYQDHFDRGDFLIRNIMNVDRDSGALVVADFMRVGQTVQFHVRDSATAHEDLDALLRTTAVHMKPRGGLLFSCNGRGSRLFPEPDHDAGLIQRTLGPLPLAGFFAQGELGPVGKKNYIHGFTASLLLFEE